LDEQIPIRQEDHDADDTDGEAVNSFGAEWYALASSGKKVDLS
jgi:hypothetical protein